LPHRVETSDDDLIVWFSPRASVLALGAAGVALFGALTAALVYSAVALGPVYPIRIGLYALGFATCVLLLTHRENLRIDSTTAVVTTSYLWMRRRRAFPIEGEVFRVPDKPRFLSLELTPDTRLSIGRASISSFSLSWSEARAVADELNRLLHDRASHA